MIFDTLLLVCVGLSLEVVYTAALNFKSSGNWRLMGHTYVWMIPLYALVYPILSWVYPAAFIFERVFRALRALG